MDKLARSGRRSFRRRSGGFGRSFATEDFEHDRAAGGAFAFDGFAAVLHQLLDGIDNLFFRLALNAVSFGHKKLLTKNTPAAPVLNVPLAYGAAVGSVNSENRGPSSEVIPP